MPVRNVLVSNAGGDVKHYDATLALNIVAIAEATKFFLSSSIPDIENNCAKVCRER